MLFSKSHKFNIISWVSGNSKNWIPKISLLILQFIPNEGLILKNLLGKQLILEKNIVQNNGKDPTINMTLAKRKNKVALTCEQSCKIIEILPNGAFTYCKQGKWMFNSSNVGIISIKDKNLRYKF